MKYKRKLYAAIVIVNAIVVHIRHEEISNNAVIILIMIFVLLERTDK